MCLAGMFFNKILEASPATPKEEPNLKVAKEFCSAPGFVVRFILEEISPTTANSVPSRKPLPTIVILFPSHLSVSYTHLTLPTKRIV